ncbi:histone-lysine N-methyltransferase SETMAR-like [Harpegnathos saltator]|uniref:histone-lysine N-methyltransferase SETMAR-like n=1 Tax=Harpegnathos saltator TaxID=610380 RepID=UPI000DBEEA4A|nr:histone-lysine N-methyltransferase SETMAR-like [Harpegnathos saltator]
MSVILEKETKKKQAFKKLAVISCTFRAVTERTLWKWFARFKADDFNLKDKKRPVGPPPQMKVPHDLTEKNLMDRISICDSLYKRNEGTPFLKQIVTGDEKWIIYNNVDRKRSWGKRNEPLLATPKAGLHPKKVMLCVWWDWKGILYYKLLPNNEINSEKYCSQLDELKTAIEQKRPEIANRKGVVFHQDNARPHVSLITRQKLLELGWNSLATLFDGRLMPETKQILTYTV